MGLIFVAVAFLAILLLSLYYYYFKKIKTQTLLDKRVARRERAFDRNTTDDEDLEMQEVPLDDLKVPPKATTRK